MSNPNKFMFNGQWLDLQQYRIAKGLDPKPEAPKNVFSTESVLKEQKALEKAKSKEKLVEELKEAGEDVEEYLEVIVTEDVAEGEPAIYEGEKPVEEMTYFEMLKTAKELGHVFENKPSKKEVYDLLIKQ